MSTINTRITQSMMRSLTEFCSRRHHKIGDPAVNNGDPGSGLNSSAKENAISFSGRRLRVGNSRFGFLSKLLVFCEQKSKIGIRSWKTVNPLQLLFCKEQRERFAHCCSLKRATEQGEQFGLGHKKGKAVKNCQKNDEKYKFFQLNHSFLRAKEQITIESLTLLELLFCKERF